MTFLYETKTLSRYYFWSGAATHWVDKNQPDTIVEEAGKLKEELLDFQDCCLEFL